MIRPPRPRVLPLLCLATLARCAGADPLPLWEAGAGVAALRLPDYRGSDQSHDYALPLPWLVYRGERLQVDRESVRGELFKSGRARLDLSFTGAPPVRAGGDRARAGMPGLGATGEIGPALKLRLNPRPGAFSADLLLPARAALVAQGGVRGIGYTFDPRVDLGWRAGAGRHVDTFGVSFGPMFGDRRYHGYYYTVAPQYAAASRPAWTAPGGYAGTQLVLSATAQRGDWWLGAFARADDMAGARVADSPLVRTRRDFGAGVAVSRVFARSRREASAGSAP